MALDYLEMRINIKLCHSTFPILFSQLLLVYNTNYIYQVYSQSEVVIP